MISIASKLNELRPEVTTQVLARYPEFVKLIQSSMTEYKDILRDVIESDDTSLKQVYVTASKDLDNATQSRQQLIDLAGKILADLSKCLDDPNLTQEERAKILAQEMEIFQTAYNKDAEIRTHETEMVHIVDKKDSEKRQFNWSIIKAASVVLIIGIGISASVLGGNFNIKLPQKL